MRKGLSYVRGRRQEAASSGDRLIFCGNITIWGATVNKWLHKPLHAGNIHVYVSQKAQIRPCGTADKEAKLSGLGLEFAAQQLQKMRSQSMALVQELA